MFSDKFRKPAATAILAGGMLANLAGCTSNVDKHANNRMEQQGPTVRLDNGLRVPVKVLSLYSDNSEHPDKITAKAIAEAFGNEIDPDNLPKDTILGYYRYSNSRSNAVVTRENMSEFIEKLKEAVLFEKEAKTGMALD